VKAGVYFGRVTHRRLRPVAHSLAYDVATVFVNVDDLAGGQLPGLLSYNHWNLFTLRDADHGYADGRPIADFAWDTVRNCAQDSDITEIFMLCYPRMLGYGFNPLTCYFCCDRDGRTRMMIYEVRNTFGGRHVYVTDVFHDDAPNYARAQKRLYVSPFNKVEGEYGLRASEPGASVSVGVSLTTSEGPLLKAYFSGKYKPLSNWQLLRICFGLPLMSFKVVAAIHWEALKLWRKGLKVQSH
jgi:uncharacterized protein